MYRKMKVSARLAAILKKLWHVSRAWRERFSLVYRFITIPQNRMDTIPDSCSPSARMYAMYGTHTRAASSTLSRSVSVRRRKLPFLKTRADKRPTAPPMRNDPMKMTRPSAPAMLLALTGSVLNVSRER